MFARATLTLLLWGIAVWPSLAGSVTSHTPKSSLFIGVASRSQLSVRKRYDTVLSLFRTALTEVADEECLCDARSPFSVCDIPILADIEAEFLKALSEDQNCNGMIDWFH